MDILRVGKISSINTDEGKCRVVYSDRDNCTTIEMPLIVFNNEYYIPKVDDQVLVLHQPNGSVSGFVLGDFWSETHKTPEHTGEDYRRKTFDRDDKCYWEYCGDDDGSFKFHNDDDIATETEGKSEQKSNDDMTLISKNGKIEIKGKTQVKVNSDGSITVECNGSISIKGGDVAVKGSNISVQGSTVSISGNTSIDGANFLEHTHNCTAPGSPSGPVLPT